MATSGEHSWMQEFEDDLKVPAKLHRVTEIGAIQARGAQQAILASSPTGPTTLKTSLDYPLPVGPTPVPWCPPPSAPAPSLPETSRSSGVPAPAATASGSASVAQGATAESSSSNQGADPFHQGQDPWRRYGWKHPPGAFGDTSQSQFSGVPQTSSTIGAPHARPGVSHPQQQPYV